ncbi:hypothetical protein PNA2_0163 [Pyrococcus sp. NA2]|uniref:PfkB family carbohydrate kinase n=1 Tax=Pyrococcus sp. (strain NA2) TaxID=342949 RepID=UPI000209AED4|nr:PfkB family carbohydrate kinase [Pyrococcus sp. NA2]AEC51081.1 hypothetical protein PNA2_0163 [Pyrococcus sp. NA2]
MKFGIVGNLTIDVINGDKRPGGGAYYSGLVLSKFGKVVIYTKIGEDYPRKWLEEIENFAEVVKFKAKSTTKFALHYKNGERTIKVLSKGEMFSRDELESISERNIIINPVANELSPEDVEIFKKPSLDVQGFIRELRDKVELKEIDGSFLSKAFVVHASLEEYLKIRNPGKPDVFAITNGAKEGRLITREGELKFKPRPVSTNDPTGAGDCFLALLTYGILKFGIRDGLEFALRETEKFLSLGLKRYIELR